MNVVHLLGIWFTLSSHYWNLWQLTGDIHEEVETHNRMLDRMVC